MGRFGFERWRQQSKMKTIVAIISAVGVALCQIDTGASAPKSFGHFPPRFEDYPVAKAFTGKPASIDFNNETNARRYRTQLKTQSVTGPDFCRGLRCRPMGLRITVPNLNDRELEIRQGV